MHPTDPADLTTAFESLIRYLPVEVMVSDENGRILCFNAAAQRTLGLDALDAGPDERARAIGSRLRDTVTPFPTNWLPLARAIRGKVVEDVEIFVRAERARPRQHVWSPRIRPTGRQPPE